MARLRVPLQHHVEHCAPVGVAQRAHRGFHMGFFSPDKCVKFPRLLQIANQTLTLRGAVSHSDTPLPNGPTRFLPFSQLFEAGYMAHRRDEFQKFFQEHDVSVPLEKGDGVFFNPLILPAAGNNLTIDFYRSAQLIEVNSIFRSPASESTQFPLSTSAGAWCGTSIARRGSVRR